MQVTCPACSTRYSTDDAKVRGKTVRMRCRACDTVWLVQGPPKDEGRRSAKSAAPYAHHPSQPPSHLADAFGGEDLATGRVDVPREARRAGRESPDAHTEKRAAVVKRGTDREHRDLFASQMPDEGSVKQTLRPPPFGVCVGARSEDSVLFTVDSLRAAAKLQTPPPAVYLSASPALAEDEGVIDLHALSARPAAYAVSPLGLGSEPPIGFAREIAGTSGFPAQASAAMRSRGPWIAAGASLAAMALAALSAVALFGGAIPQRAARSAAAHVTIAAASAGSRAHELAAKQEADKKATEKLAADKAEAEKEALATKKSSGKAAKGGRPAAWGATRGVASASTPRPAPKPAGDACGCKGDFTCILRCSAKGK